MARSGPVTRDSSTVQLGLSKILIGRSAPHMAITTPVLNEVTDSMGAMANTSFNGESEYFDLESGYPLGLDATFPLRENNSLECAFKEITPKNLAISRGMDPFADISATVTLIDSVTVGGGVSGSITVDDLGGVTTETFTVVFTSTTAFAVYGTVTGHVGDGTISTEFAPQNGSEDYFVIPANYFDANWLTDETYVFATTAFLSGSSAFGDAHSGSVALGTITAPKFMRVEAVYTFPNGVNKMTIIFPRANAVSSLAIDNQAEDVAAVTLSLKSTTASADADGGNAAWNAMSQGQILFT